MGQAKGFVLVGALVMVLVLGVLVTTATFSGYSNRINTSDAINTYRAQLAAEAGLDYALYKVWHEVWGSEKDRSYERYVLLLANYLPLDPHNPSASIKNEELKLEDGIRANISIQRNDVLDTNTGDLVISFVVNSTGWLADNYTARKLQQTIQIREPQRGFDFALLTNNANCIFCHTRVRPLEALAGPPSEQNPWKRIKVGILESLEVRRADDISATNHDAKSFVAGTVYTRGSLNISKFRSDSDWIPYARETVVGGIPDMRFKTMQSPDTLKITDEALQPFSAVNCQDGNCKRGQNFYFNYPNPEMVKTSLQGIWPDDELPEKFPLPIRDLNNNRLVDESEWTKAIDDSLNGQDKNNPRGQISGGSITTNPSNPTQWPSSGNTSILGSGYKGSVILDGRSLPLAISGTVYIDGDIILRGYIQGKGKLIVRGNAYVLGDVVYRCGDQECTAQQYAEGVRNPRSETLPRFALAATGNVIIGDFLTPRYGNALDDNTVDTGCMNPDRSLRGSCRFASFTMQELTVFNEKELARAINNPSYIPRFYALIQGQPIYFNSYGLDYQNGKTVEVYDSEGMDSYWYYDYLSPSRPSSDTLAVRVDGKKKIITALEANTILSRAIITTLSPQSIAPQTPWISSQNLKRLWNSSIERSSLRQTAPYRFDGLLYSANGIFSIIRGVLERDASGNPTTLSKTKGSWDLRGALVAADTGVLTPGSPNRSEVGGLNLSLSAALSIYYDQRMAEFFSVRDVNELRPFRSDWKMVAR